MLLPDCAELGLIEAPALDADYGNSWDRAAVWWKLVDAFFDRGIPVGMVAPTTLKKWSTNNGRADKRLVVAAMKSMWPGVPCTNTEQRHHECDALAIATMCAQHLNWPVSYRPHQQHSAIKWPVPA